MHPVQHRFIDSNRIRMHLAEQGEGPVVVLCHGWPESWYSWRHHMAALAEAGYRAVAPDQRGYGQTDAPEAVEAYHILHLTADIVGVVHALGQEQAIIVGHDWGSAVAWYCALLRPDMFRRVILMSVPYLQRNWNDPRPTDAMRLIEDADHEFYQSYFQEPAGPKLNWKPMSAPRSSGSSTEDLAIPVPGLQSCAKAMVSLRVLAAERPHPTGSLKRTLTSMSRNTAAPGSEVASTGIATSTGFGKRTPSLVVRKSANRLYSSQVSTTQWCVICMRVHSTLWKRRCPD